MLLSTFLESRVATWYISALKFFVDKVDVFGAAPMKESQFISLFWINSLLSAYEHKQKIL